MKFVADVHLHSHFSRATSKQLNLEHLHKWAQLKGVQVVGTGDVAHPGWLEEMKRKLEPAEEGLFRLKQEYSGLLRHEVPKACIGDVRFILAGEISNIYKKHDKVRKIHNVVFLPSFEAVERLQAELDKIGNIRSDGRPILGLPSRDLLEILLEADPQAYLIPAHIWTPWFALFGSMSGYDSIEECFEDLTPHIFALETGLSSDPPMNWRLSALDDYTLVSNSDAHSPQKLAREANLFRTELSYPAIFEALKTGDPQKFGGTIEFFPEEGKYHYDGHRKCGVRWHPQSTIQHKGICPECGKKATVGVMHRVESLADRPIGEKPANRHPFTSLIPLPEILAEIHNVGVNTKKVRGGFDFLLSKLGSELNILMNVPPEDLAKFGGAMLSVGITRMRNGEVQIAAGYDGEYGTIRLFDERERQELSAQLGFFEQQVKQASEATVKSESSRVSEASESKNCGSPRILNGSGLDAETSHAVLRENVAKPDASKQSEPTSKGSPILDGLNPEQRVAVQHTREPLLILAGPGTGKTRTLTHRLVYLVLEKGVPARNLLAVTFTNKAAEEMVSRIHSLAGNELASEMTISTFHALGLRILKEEEDHLDLPARFRVCDETERLTILRQTLPNKSEKEIRECLDRISRAKNHLVTPATAHDDERFKEVAGFGEVYANYQAALQELDTLDFDDLIFATVTLLQKCPEITARLRERFRWISVDEYQDINPAQYQLLQLLTAPETNLCVIGDPDQSIYGFRGADRRFFLRFQDDFPKTHVVRLTKNYRSTDLILGASVQIISKNDYQDRAEVWSEVVSETKVDVYQAPTDRAEAENVVHEIEEMVGGTSYFSMDSGRVGARENKADRSFRDFAVLFRLSAQSRLLGSALKRSGMPFQVVGETPFFERRRIREYLAYLWFLRDPHSDVALRTILQDTSNGLGEAGINKIAARAQQNTTSLWQALQSAQQSLQLDRRSHNRPTDFIRDLNRFCDTCSNKPIAESLELASRLFAWESRLNQDGQTELQKLVLRSRPFEGRLGDFLDSTMLQTDGDDYDGRADQVTLMTLHAAKGLEFPVVFIVGCEEGLIPFYKDRKDDPDFEEERRLLYVGMTRARERLILVHAKTRFLFGQRLESEPSRFLQDIEAALKNVREAPKFEKKTKPVSAQASLF